MSSRPFSQVLTAPIARKLHPSLMGLPSSIRQNIIEKFFEDITIQIIPPAIRRFSPILSTGLKTRLAFAGANKELQEQVYNYVFTLRRVLFYCEYIRSISLTPDREKVVILFERIKQLQVNRAGLNYFTPNSNTGHAASIELLPNLEILLTQSNYNWAGSACKLSCFAQEFHERHAQKSITHLAHGDIFDFLRSEQPVAFDVVIYLESCYEGVPEFVALFINGELVIKKANCIPAEVWMKQWTWLLNR